MANDLTTSFVERQNILNNSQVIIETKRVLQLPCIVFDGEEYITKAMAARFYDVDIKTVDRYLSSDEGELKSSGYRNLKGIALSRFLIEAAKVPGSGIERTGAIVQLGIFNLRAFLNLGMLLVESQNARLLRKTMLDIVMDFINLRTGGSTKYVNQRDRQFLDSYLREANYRREFTDALDHYVEKNPTKYGIFTNKVYRSIFCEKAEEYRNVLSLKSSDRIRDTFYSEILTLIASYEHGFAVELEKESKAKGRKLSFWEASELFAVFERNPLLEPLINQARSKMASRDLAFRDAFHAKLEEYIQPVTAEEIEHFFGRESEQVEQIMAEHREQIGALADIDLAFERLLTENEDVLKRLKERE